MRPPQVAFSDLGRSPSGAAKKTQGSCGPSSLRTWLLALSLVSLSGWVQRHYISASSSSTTTSVT